MKNSSSIDLARIGKLIVIGQISSYFGFLILSLRHFCIYPALHYRGLVVIMLIGFLPSVVYRLFPLRYAPYILVLNALLLVSLIFSLMQEWALAGVFVLVPVFSLLFQDKKIYIFASVSSFLLNIILAFLFLFESEQAALQAVIMLDVLTVFIILVFIVYFIVKDLRWQFMEEARNLQTILTLSRSLEAKDPYTQGHSE